MSCREKIRIPRTSETTPNIFLLLVFMGPILLVADMFHPVCALTIGLFHDGNVGHGCGWGGAMPMLLPRGEPNHVPRTNRLDRTSPALCQSETSRHDQSLSQWMTVP